MVLNAMFLQKRKKIKSIKQDGEALKKEKKNT